MEYDWFPASFTTIDQLIRPVVLLVRLPAPRGHPRLDPAAAAASGTRSSRPWPAARDARRGIAAAVERGERSCPGHPFRFDAIGLCFPDVVVRDKIVGGEVYKTRGIRENPALDYEREFRRLSHLDDGAAGLRPARRSRGDRQRRAHGRLHRRGGDRGRSTPASVERGVFAHTLGTELGTGWVTEAGAIPDIPLEVYNCVIDLGSYPERRYEPDDVRSVNNFNTRLPGTLQKYTSQSGVFRLAAKYLPEARPGLFRELFDAGVPGSRTAPRCACPTAARRTCASRCSSS